MVTLPTNFKVAKFDNEKGNVILRQLEQEIDAVRFDPGDGTKIELPVKLRVHDSIFVPLAKWAMLLAGNYRCVTADGMRTAQEAVHSDIETSRSVYNFVFDLCVKLGANPADLVPFEKYAAAAQSLTRPASAARALQNGAQNIERADKLVQLIARQKGLSHPVDRRARWRWSMRDSMPTARRRRPDRRRRGPAVSSFGARRHVGGRRIFMVLQRLRKPARSYSQDHRPNGRVAGRLAAGGPDSTGK